MLYIVWKISYKDLKTSGIHFWNVSEKQNKPQEESQTKHYSILFFLSFFLKGGFKKCLMLMEKFLPVYVFCLHRIQLSKHRPNFKHFNSSFQINRIMLVLDLDA